MSFKPILYFIVFICFSNINISAQTNLYKTIQVNTVLTNYSVTAANDTTYSSEVIITMNDTIGFQNLTATLSLKTLSGWQTISTNTLTKPLANINCTTPLCLSRKNGTEWVLYLGSYSLLTRHEISINFTGLYIQTNTSWSDEF